MIHFFVKTQTFITGCAHSNSDMNSSLQLLQLHLVSEEPLQRAIFHPSPAANVQRTTTSCLRPFAEQKSNMRLTHLVRWLLFTLSVGAHFVPNLELVFAKHTINTEQYVIYTKPLQLLIETTFSTCFQFLSFKPIAMYIHRDIFPP